MAKRLTDKQKKLIIADYVECENISAVAKRFGISRDTVKRIVNSDSRTAQIVTEKKEQNTQDVLAYLDSKSDSLKRLGDYILDERLNPDLNKNELKAMPIRDLVMAYGTITDKMLKSKEILYKTKSDVSVEKINQNIQNIANLMALPVPVRKIPDDE